MSETRTVAVRLVDAFAPVVVAVALSCAIIGTSLIGPQVVTITAAIVTAAGFTLYSVIRAVQYEAAVRERDDIIARLLAELGARR